jgi:hypothetical protein
MKWAGPMLARTNDLFERWHPFWLWECVNDGMWQQRKNQMSRIQECARVLSDPHRCENSMRQAVAVYPISAEQHLSKPYGRQPWMGQAACCAVLGATEEETRIAWNFYMTAEAQASANAIADRVIAEWEMANA